MGVGGLTRDRQALAQRQQPAGAAGGGLAFDIQKHGAECGPLGLRPGPGDGLAGGGQEIHIPSTYGGGQCIELARGEVFGGGEEGAAPLDRRHMVADAAARGAGERGKRVAMAASGVSKWPSSTVFRMRAAFS